MRHSARHGAGWTIPRSLRAGGARNPAHLSRLALELVVERIDLKPLDGDWQYGRLLQIKTRPWAVAVPKGEVARSFGSGGGI